jgi:hypothetical protein
MAPPPAARVGALLAAVVCHHVSSSARSMPVGLHVRALELALRGPGARPRGGDWERERERESPRTPAHEWAEVGPWRALRLRGGGRHHKAKEHGVRKDKV